MCVAPLGDSSQLSGMGTFGETRPLVVTPSLASPLSFPSRQISYPPSTIVILIGACSSPRGPNDSGNVICTARGEHATQAKTSEPTPPRPRANATLPSNSTNTKGRNGIKQPPSSSAPPRSIHTTPQAAPSPSSSEHARLTPEAIASLVATRWWMVEIVPGAISFSKDVSLI